MVATGSVAVLTPPPIAHAAAGCIGSALSLLLFYPLERARIELQAHAPDDTDDNVTSHSHRFTMNPQSVCKPVQSVTTQAQDTYSPVSQQASLFKSSAARQTATKQSCKAVHKEQSILSCLIRLRKQRQLYRGVQPVVITLALSNFIFFYALQACKQLLTVHYRNMGLFTATNPVSESAYHGLLATSLAGILNVLITNPLWVVNLRLVQGEDNHSGNIDEEKKENSTPCIRKQGFFDVLQDIAQNEGIGQLWSGTLASLLLVSNPAIQFFIYEQGKTHLLQYHTLSFLNPRRLWKVIRDWDIRHIRLPLQPSMTTTSSINLNPFEAFFLGALSKGIATILTYPLQLAQVIVRLQKETRISSSKDAKGTSGVNVKKLQEAPQFSKKTKAISLEEDSYQNLVSQHTRRFKGTWDCIIQLYRKGGLRALYTGMDAKLLLNILSAAFTFLTYEQILRFVTTGRL